MTMVWAEGGPFEESIATIQYVLFIALLKHSRV